MSTHHDDTGRTKPTDERPQDAGSTRLQHAQERTEDQDDAQEREGGQVSEAGGGALNEETAEGGADAVPDTPDVNR